MKIFFAYPGHLHTVPMGGFCLNALKELGHEVAAFDFRDRLVEKLHHRLAALFGRHGKEEKAAMNRRLRRKLDAFHPDLFLTLFGFDVSIETLAHLRHQGIPSACWWLNDPFQFARSVQKAAYYDIVFTNSDGCVADYRAAGVRQAFFLPPACDPRVHRRVPASPDHAAEVCFAGDWSPLRQQLMEAIATRWKVKVFGPWKKKLPPDSPLLPHLQEGFFTPDKMACIFSSAKVVLNLHTWHGRFDHGVNPRLFEAAGCASLQLVDWKREIPALFACPGELLTYRTLDEVPALVGMALRDESARQAAAEAVQRRAYAQHTYRHRMETLIQTVRAAEK